MYSTVGYLFNLCVAYHATWRVLRLPECRRVEVARSRLTVATDFTENSSRITSRCCLLTSPKPAL